MRITMVLPFPYWTGGVRAVYEHSRILQSSGHEVRVVFPAVPYRFRGASGWASARAWLGSLRRNLLSGAHPPGVPVRWDIRMVPTIADRYLPDGDIVLATAWPTAYSVARLSRRKGVKTYLVQHREIDSGPARRVDGTYRLGLFLIAGSHFTSRHLQETIRVMTDAVAVNGVDVSFWGAREPSTGARSGVLTLLASGERKGGADAIAALAAVHRARPGARLRAFGQTPQPGLPAFIEYQEHPDDAALRELYATSEVFLYSSRFEGFGLPPLEAQAAGCAVVSTRVGDVPECIADGANGVLVEPRDVSAMASAVIALLDEPERRERIAAAGAASVAAHDWRRVPETLERALDRALAAACAPASAAAAAAAAAGRGEK